MNKDEIFDQLADDFKHTKWNDSSLVDIGNSIIKMSLKEDNPKVLESMFYALYTLVAFRDVAKFLSLDLIIDNIYNYNAQCLEHILGVLSYTGNQQYLDIIYKIHNLYPDLEVQDYINELNYRFNNL